MDSQTIINTLTGLVAFFGGIWVKSIADSIKDMRATDSALADKVQGIELLVAGQYVKREELDKLGAALQISRVVDAVNVIKAQGVAAIVNVHPVSGKFQVSKRVAPTLILSSLANLSTPGTATGINSGSLTSVTLPTVSTESLGVGTGVCAGSVAGYNYYGYFGASAQM